MPTLTDAEIMTLRRWSENPFLFEPTMASHCELLGRAAATILELKEHNRLLGKAIEQLKKK